MNKNISEQELLKVIKHSLDQSTLQLDSAIIHRLQIARQTALKPAERNYKFQWLGAVAVSALLIVVLWQVKPKPALESEDLLIDEIMLTEDNQELIMNFDFYSWLDKSQSQG
jgi:hypothetical protein